MNTSILKTFWGKLDLGSKLFLSLIILFHAVLVTDFFTVGLSFAKLFDYALWTWLVVPMIYSDKFTEAWKDPFLKVYANYKASVGEDDVKK